ncbi:MAG: hypothetical protein EAZ18_03800 [Oscillatoriales cyanobacterium]|nr:MAG: hypothetical protein EAZ18_03800 [Oscillatoriales cyanobacterium]
MGSFLVSCYALNLDAEQLPESLYHDRINLATASRATLTSRLSGSYGDIPFVSLSENKNKMQLLKLLLELDLWLYFLI